MAVRQFLSLLVASAIISPMLMPHPVQAALPDDTFITEQRCKIRLPNGKTATVERGAVVLKRFTEPDGNAFVLVNCSGIVDLNLQQDDFVCGTMSPANLARPGGAIEELTSSISNSPNDPAPLIGRGNVYLYQQRIELAIADYRSAIELSPRNPMALLRCSEALRRAGQFDEAITASSEAIGIAPKLVPAYLVRARARSDLGQYQESIDDCTTAIELNPNGHAAYCCRSFFRCLTGEMKLAISDAESWHRAMNRARGISASPDSTDTSKASFQLPLNGPANEAPASVSARLLRDQQMHPLIREMLLVGGVYAQHLGLNEQAIGFLNVANQCSLPTQAEFRVLYHRGLAKEWTLKSNDAIVDFNRAAKLLKNHPELVTGVSAATLEAEQACCRSNRCRALGNNEGALTESEEAIRLDPSLTAGYLMRGSAWLKKDEFDKAMADADKVLKTSDIDKDCRSLALYLRASIESRDNLPTAINDVTEAIRLCPNRKEPWLLRARCRTSIGEFDKSIADCDEAIRLDPNTAQAYLMRADNSLRQKQFETCVDDCTKTISLEPKNVRAFLMRGNAYIGANKPAKAMADLEHALAMNPNSAEAYSRVAWIQATCPNAALRNGALAVANAQKACELDKWEHDGAIATLAAAHAEAGEFEEAKKYLRKAIEMAPSKNLEVRKKAMTAFEKGQPYRDDGPPAKE